MNRSFLDYLVILALALWLLSLYRLLEAKGVGKHFRAFFFKKNKLPYDYEVVHKLLDGLIKEVAEKYDIEIKFKIHKALIHTTFGECEAVVSLKNHKQNLSFPCFKKINTPYKKTSHSSLQHLCMILVSQLEDSIVNFLILDNLITLNKKLSAD